MTKQIIIGVIVAIVTILLLKVFGFLGTSLKEVNYEKLASKLKTDTDFVEAVSEAMSSNVDASISERIKAGLIVPFAGSAPKEDSGWLVCDGSELSRAKYSSLFATIGERWGAGDGSTTFNLPDFEDRFVYGTTKSNLVGESIGNLKHDHDGVAATTGESKKDGFGAVGDTNKKAGDTPPPNQPHYNHTHDFTADVAPGSSLPPAFRVIFLIRAI